ncbi:hypothetical protein MRX96_012039 [Rhipicephalus microplus]
MKKKKQPAAASFAFGSAHAFFVTRKRNYAPRAPQPRRKPGGKLRGSSSREILSQLARSINSGERRGNAPCEGHSQSVGRGRPQNGRDARPSFGQQRFASEDDSAERDVDSRKEWKGRTATK